MQIDNAQDGIKGRARLGIYGKVPIALLQEEWVTLNTVKTYAALASFQGNKESCWPSRNAIAERAGLKADKVSSAITKLVGHKWAIRRIRGQGRSNIYSVLFPVLDFVSDIAESATLDIAESAISRNCGKRNLPIVREKNKGKEQGKKSKESKASVQAPGVELRTETGTNQELPKAEQLAALPAPPDAPSREEFNEAVQMGGLVWVERHKPDLYDELDGNKWRLWDSERRRWEAIVNWRLLIAGLNATIQEASDNGSSKCCVLSGDDGEDENPF